tara:strand:- start:12 stop:185 length:174 start_codon:yes stop_codon:yes gene_type:complete
MREVNHVMNPEETKEFIEEVYEIAFGDNAINRDFTTQDVLDQLRQFSDDSCDKHEYE